MLTTVHINESISYVVRLNIFDFVLVYSYSVFINRRLAYQATEHQIKGVRLTLQSACPRQLDQIFRVAHHNDEQCLYTVQHVQ